MIQSNISSWNVTGKTVIVRMDGNVPIQQQQILDDHKLIASLATISYLLDHGAQLLLLPDITQSDCNHDPDAYVYLADWYYHEGLPVKLAASSEDAQLLLETGNRIVMLAPMHAAADNFQQQKFAQQIALLGSYYINDAFSALANTDHANIHIPNLFDIDHKSIGFLIEHELRMLDKLADSMQQPSLLFIGGIERIKIDLIKALLPKINGLYIGPALNFSFLKAAGQSVGMSRIAPELFNDCHEIMMMAEEYKVPIRYPLDYVISDAPHQHYYDISTCDKLDSHECGISIGPKTAASWAQDCMLAQTIILHGLMGFLHKPEGLLYFRQLLQAIHDSPATSIITGSSTVAAAHLLGLAYDVRYCSTGGSATLAYLGNKHLPGLSALMT